MKEMQRAVCCRCLFLYDDEYDGHSDGDDDERV
jgi:hypothetical protein